MLQLKLHKISSLIQFKLCVNKNIYIQVKRGFRKTALDTNITIDLTVYIKFSLLILQLQKVDLDDNIKLHLFYLKHYQADD